MKKYNYPGERIAVVAMGCLMPDAVNTDLLWKNILNKKISIKDVPDHIVNTSLYYRPEVRGKANKNDKTYTKVVAIPDEINFLNLSRKYRIPPAMAEYFDTNQKAAIYCVDQAVEKMKSSLPKERTAVILCSGSPGGKFENVVRRTFFATVENAILNHPRILGGESRKMEEILKEVSTEVLKNTQSITEDTTTGYLQNITASRISNIFDLWGPSYVIDSACASSLTAIAVSVAGLLNHEYDAVISGGVEVSLSEVPLIAFSGINAFSPDGSYPFDSRANGFVTGLGGGIAVLKRLSDALRDGDQIYSIISGYGQGSDGKGKYIAAPSEEGQVRTIQSACKMSGYSVDTIEMVEAHGTGTIVGDVVEVSALKKAFASLGAQKGNNCGLGSIKSNIGHLRNAAGIAGFIKATLALQNKVLPATANIQEVNPKLGLEGSPFYVLNENKKWMENSTHPRRANVSAYGFGGANYHLCLEEFRPEFLQKTYSFSSLSESKNTDQSLETLKGKEEVVFFSGDSIEDIERGFKSFVDHYEDGSFEKAVYIHNLSVSSDKDWRISICADSLEQLKDKWQLLTQYISEEKLSEANHLNLRGIYIGKGPKVSSSQIAFMFPGQGSQYPNMLKELYETYPAVKSFYLKADALWKAKYNNSVMPLLLAEDEGQLKNTKNTHPAMFLSNMGMYTLLCEAGLKADYMIGHSLGEITSLFAGEMVDLKSAINIIGERGFSFDGIDVNKRGKMISVRAKGDKLKEIIGDNGFKISIANINSDEQTVVGGESEEIDRFFDFLAKNSYKHTVLNVSHAFHTSMVTKAADAFYEIVKDIKFNHPKSKIMACHLTDFYNDLKIENMADLLKDQILSSVNFKDSILKLYDSGVRVFIETGPSNVLTNLVKNILSDKDVKIVNTNNKSKCSVEAFKQGLAALFAYGVEVSSVPSNHILGLQEEGTASVVYNVGAKTVDLSFDKNNGLKQEFTGTMQKDIVNSNPGKPLKESLVYSGVSMGLPGTFKKAFSDDNFQYIREGRNLIELLTEDEAESILDLNITRLVKTEKEAVFKKISSVNEVIHFLGKFGKIDMINDYLIDEKVLNQMSQTVCAGIAAGYEALKDAGIPLVREYKKTASGAVLPGRLLLPSNMQEDTGIVFANGLCPIEPIISEVSKYTAAKFSSSTASTRKELLKFFEDVISKVSDYDTKKVLADWFTLHYSRLANNPAESQLYEFNHKLLTLITSYANNWLAQFIGAKGPNMHINAACSSTLTAVTVAEDIIRAGHAERMIVVGADITSGKNLLPWFGAAFSSVGALTDSDNLYEAAVPFDNRRNGMILGSGAVGLVIEKEAEVAKRGMNGICRILGTHLFNAAAHQSKIDTGKHCIELNKFISKMENDYHFDRNEMASKTVYCAHETYSHKDGGCSSMEKASLERAFGEKFREIKVISTKGMTGHTMGASIEEAVSAKALQYQKIPPIANYRESDPNLVGLNLSRGGEYDFEYVIRAGSAFGGNGNYHLLQRVARREDRIIDKKTYRKWIEEISSQDAELKNYGRVLVAEGKTSNMTPGGFDNEELEPDSGYKSTQLNSITNVTTNIKTDMAVKVNPQTVTDDVLAVYSEITKYPKEMLELSMELEADLGIDTVKQATIFSILAEKFNLVLSEGEALSNYPTIGHMVGLVLKNANSPETVKIEDNLPEKQEIVNTRLEVLNLISEITKYPVDMLEDGMELEADLGIDTIKQATIFSILRDRFGINEEKGNVASYNTIGAIIEAVKQNSNKASCELSKVGIAGSGENSQDKQGSSLAGQNGSDIRLEVLNLISEITKYPVDMLEDGMELEADLGIDTIKQATIFSILRDKFETDEEKGDVARYTTIRAIVEGVRQNSKKSGSELINSSMLQRAESFQYKKSGMGEIKVAGRINTRQQVLDLISEITKYPVEMLEDDMELEADLGIDTIKQATIFSELRERFTLDADTKINPSQFKTIKAIVDVMENSVSKPANHDESAADANMNAEADILSESDNHFEIELCVQHPVVVEENIKVKDYDLNKKNVIVIGDHSETVKKAAKYFKKNSSCICEFVFEKCLDSNELEKRVHDMKDQILTADVVIDLGHLGDVFEFEKFVGGMEKEVLSLNSLVRFQFYKYLIQIRPDPVLRILCVVSMDGCFGFADQKNLKIDPYYGALCGFYKGLRKEFGKSKVKIVDLSSFEGLTDEVLSRLAAEIKGEFDPYEIGYRDDTRVTLKLDNVDRLELTPVESLDSKHIFITGGGNGITAEIVLGISKIAKAKFTIIGRTSIPSNIEALSKLDGKSLEQKKMEIYDRLKKEGKKAAPAEVQKEYNRLMNAISVYKLLESIRKNGGEANYFSSDVTDYESLKETLKEAVRAFGPVNVIIHGAGIEKSNHISRKTEGEFKEVFSTKAAGLCNLYRLADKKELKVLIGFSSISGRFGNEAQLDYCSANSFISSFMSMVKSQEEGIRALSISWSGWKDKGMAWRNEFVKENSEELGLNFIEPDRGTGEFINILMSKINLDEIVISKGLSLFTGSQKWHGMKNPAPLIDWISKKDRNIESVYKVLSVKRDPIIDHHRLGKTPLMPAVGFMEMGAETHSLIFGKKDHYCFKNIKLDNALKLYNEKPQEIIMKLKKSDSGDLIEAVFYNYFKPKIGKTQLVKLNSMKVSGNIADFEYLSELRRVETDNMIEITLKDSIDQASQKLNNAINLGPLFMNDKSAKINKFKYNEKGGVLTVALSEEQISNKKYNLNNLLINPAFADSLMQACGVHSSVGTDEIYLPWEIGEFGVVKAPKEPGLFKAYAKMIENTDQERSYHVVLYNDKGELCYYAKNVIVKRILQ
ncbi:MAG: SDR family NAD(P)-dependent oxidoreductase [Clostridia bacterium]|nr:SDR family NAD(P)-dependent oxidoreductase [Clostridia bacterium]